MTVQGFQFAVTSRMQPGVQVYVVAASTPAIAERLLQREQAVGVGSSIELQRRVTPEDLAKHGLTTAGVIRIR